MSLAVYKNLAKPPKKKSSIKLILGLVNKFT